MSIATASLPTAALQRDYTARLIANLTVAPPSHWRITHRPSAEGLQTLSPAGQISGLARQLGVFHLTVADVDSTKDAMHATRELTLRVRRPPIVTGLRPAHGAPSRPDDGDHHGLRLRHGSRRDRVRVRPPASARRPLPHTRRLHRARPTPQCRRRRRHRYRARPRLETHTRGPLPLPPLTGNARRLRLASRKRPGGIVPASVGDQTQVRDDTSWPPPSRQTLGERPGISAASRQIQPRTRDLTPAFSPPLPDTTGHARAQRPPRWAARRGSRRSPDAGWPLTRAKSASRVCTADAVARTSRLRAPPRDLIRGDWIRAKGTWRGAVIRVRAGVDPKLAGCATASVAGVALTPNLCPSSDRRRRARLCRRRSSGSRQR